MPSRRVVLALGGVVVGLVVLVLLLPTSLVDSAVERSAGRMGGSCSELIGVEVDSGAWPTVARALSGRLRDVSIHVDEMRSGGFSYHDVSFSASEVEVAPLGGLLSERSPRVRGGEASATVRFDDIEREIARYGATVQLRQQGSSLVADVDVPFLGPVPTTVDIGAVDGDMELVFAPLDAFPLPAVPVPIPEPFAFQGVEVQDDALRFDSAVDGVIPTDDLGCDVEP